MKTISVVSLRRIGTNLLILCFSDGFSVEPLPKLFSGRDHMVAGFIPIYAASAHHH
jgi:hypothetical protein